MMPESDKQVETSPVFTFFHIFVAVEILNLLIFQGDKGDDDGDVDWDGDGDSDGNDYGDGYGGSTVRTYMLGCMGWKCR